MSRFSEVDQPVLMLIIVIVLHLPFSPEQQRVRLNHRTTAKARRSHSRPRRTRSPGRRKTLQVGQQMSDPASYGWGMTTRTLARVEQQLSEIDGYLELGMQDEALTQVHLTLNRDAITADEFKTCVFALLQTDRPQPWRKMVENAYRRLADPGEEAVSSAMLNYYFSIGESKLAFRFFPRRSTRFFDAWTMMQVCLELGRMDEAKKVARYCSGLLKTAGDDFTRASMADAMAAYYLRIGECESAIRLWEEAPAEPAFQRQRLCGIVNARLMQALEAANTGLRTIAEEEIDLSTEIQLPENTTAMCSEAKQELENLARGISMLAAKA